VRIFRLVQEVMICPHTATQMQCLQLLEEIHTVLRSMVLLLLVKLSVEETGLLKAVASVGK
jgi:hypothetical protein